ncbi:MULTISPECIES: tlde1 domain-containing protein [Photorhabdus]|uniref:tlde1 domain-containing protein n=1 Tax=Photorhabdus TaxID=29487 RepID=UPI000562E855|nr:MULTISPECIES: tlde1 domain-containing protein [Photorhabdus]
MTWQYSQSTGVLTHNGSFIAKGYSGRGAGINNSSMEQVKDEGPIPRGYYRINGYTNSITKVTVTLEPIMGTNTFGRTLFRIHGDRKDGTYRQASHGCIIINGSNLRKK